MDFGDIVEDRRFHCVYTGDRAAWYVNTETEPLSETSLSSLKSTIIPEKIMVILYTKTDCPSSVRARLYLEKRGIRFTDRNLDLFPVSGDAACDLAKSFRRIIVKRGDIVHEFVNKPSLSRDELRNLVVHPVDGQLRVPALAIDDILVVGFHEKTYSTIFP